MSRYILKTLLITLIIYFALGNALIVVKSEETIPITPNDEFFTAAVDYFDINPDNYSLIVTGEVNNPLNLSLDEIKAMPVTSEIVRLTCIAYKYGADSYTGVANWTGVKLSYILDLAQIEMEKAFDVSFHTPDLSGRGYSTSLNVEEAYWNDIIIAYEMNEESLPTLHGFPLRLVCPRFYGYKWIKWINYINVTAFDYLGDYEDDGYDDSPYIDVPLTIYYSTESHINTNKAKRSGNTGLETFLLALSLISIVTKRKWRFLKKNKLK